MSSSSYLSYLDLYINQGETFSVTITVSGMLEESYNFSSSAIGGNGGRGQIRIMYYTKVGTIPTQLLTLYN